MAKVYGVVNGATSTATTPVKVASTTSIKTMIQLNTAATREARVVEWWWEGDASAAAVPVAVELFFHTAVGATVTAYIAADIRKYEPNSVASLITLGTTASGYTASAEGTYTGPLGGPTHLVPPTSGIYIQYPLGRELEMAASTFVNLRNTAPAGVNVTCGISWEE